MNDCERGRFAGPAPVGVQPCGRLMAAATWLGRGAGVLLFVAGVAAAGQPSPAAPDGPYRGFGYPWENNDLGLQRVVPAPWTPVVRDGTTLRVWGRSFALGGVLPKQITSQGRLLFGREPRLDLVIDGESPFASAPPPILIEAADDRVRFRTVVSRPKYRAEAEVTLEFDGLLLVSLTLTPVGPARLERLVIELPWAKPAARFYSRYVNYDYDRQSVDPADFLAAVGRLDQPVRFGFNPTVWVGNHDVGAEWICETDEGWTPRRSAGALTFEPSPDVVLMRANVVTEAVELRKPFRLTFALHPTPVKALPADWRRVRLVGGPVPGASFDRERDRVYAMNHPDFTINFRGLPELIPLRPDARIDRGSGVRFMPYGTLYGMPAVFPRGEWKEYASYWQTDNPRAVSRNPTFAAKLGLPPNSISIIHVSPQPKSFRDFLIWEYAQAVDRWGIDGLYWDFGSPQYPSRNPNHAGGEWVARGGQFYPLFAQRELMKRTWVALKARRPDFFIMLHQVHTPVVVSGFADVILTGEALNRFFKSPQWTLEKARTDPEVYVPDYGRLPDVMWEAQYSQRRGFISMLLSQVIKWNDHLMAERPEVCAARTRTLLARTMLYDVAVSYMRNHRPTLDAVIAAQNRFAEFYESNFIGPWESAKMLRQGGERLKVSLYLPADGKRCFLVAANLGGEVVTEAVAPKIGRRAIDAETGEPVPLDAMGAAKLIVGGNDFKMLIWE